MASTKDSRQTELVGRLQNMVDDSTDFVRDLHDAWDTYYQFYQGVQDTGLGLNTDELADWAPVNLIFSHTETRLPILLDAAPLWYVMSPDGSNDESADKLTQALQAIWYGRRVPRQYKMALRDQLVLGTGALKPWWNPTLGPWVDDLEGNKLVSRRAGDVDVSWVDPFSIYPDPAARSMDEAEYVAFCSDVAGDRAARLWPSFRSDQALQIDADTERPHNDLYDRAYSWHTGGGSTRTYREREIYRVWEMYHEGGRRLTVWSGKQVIWDGDNPTPGERFPLVLFPAYERGYGLFGMSEVSQVKDLQTMINKLMFRMNTHARLTSNSPWVTDDPNFQGNNAPGATLRLMPGHTASRVPPPALPNFFFNLVQMLLEKYDTVTGVHDVTRGLRPGSVQSGIGIQQLQETALTRLRDMSRDNAAALEVLGQIVLEYMQQGYGEKRDLVHMGGQAPARATVTPGMLRTQVADPAEALGIPGAMVPGEIPEPSVEEMIDYRVLVQSAGDLPLNAMARAELAIRLYQMRDEQGLPPIDSQALLEEVSFKRRNEVVQRQQAKMQAMMQGQMAAQMGQMGPQGMPMGAGGPMGAPGGAPQGPEDPSQMLQMLQQALSPEELTILDELVTRVSQGGEPTEEEVAWVASLDPQVRQLVDTILAQLGFGGPEMAGGGPEMGIPGAFASV